MPAIPTTTPMTVFFVLADMPVDLLDVLSCREPVEVLAAEVVVYEEVTAWPFIVLVWTTTWVVAGWVIVVFAPDDEVDEGVSEVLEPGVLDGEDELEVCDGDDEDDVWDGVEEADDETELEVEESAVVDADVVAAADVVDDDEVVELSPRPRLFPTSPRAEVTPFTSPPRIFRLATAASCRPKTFPSSPLA